jgi:hypothetical protein
MTDIVERLDSWVRTALEKTQDSEALATLREARDEIKQLRERIHSQELEVVRLQREKDAIGRELARRVLDAG